MPYRVLANLALSGKQGVAKNDERGIGQCRVGGACRFREKVRPLRHQQTQFDDHEQLPAELRARN